MPEVLLDVQNLKKYFPIKTGIFSKTIGYVKAVDDVSFQIKKGETLGLVGESGCGKTTIGRSLLRLIEPTAGKVIFEGKDVTEMKTEELKRVRKDMQIIFQDPYSSLNP
ncbi:MAG TPA: ATP-binding cassette domain-containing protein, partial [Ignavibacteria bacterium]